MIGRFAPALLFVRQVSALAVIGVEVKSARNRVFPDCWELREIFEGESGKWVLSRMLLTSVTKLSLS